MSREEAINWLKLLSLPLYNDDKRVAAIQMAIEAIKKQIPKKVVYHDDSGNKTVSERCPICFEIAHSDYCEYCGQAIDWSEEND